MFSQNLHHQMISSQGNSVEIANGMLISQTIGQQSAIGNNTNGYTVGQGFQQSNWRKYVNNNIVTAISTITYPNPFESAINFQFSKAIKDRIKIEVFDVRGRIVFEEERNASEALLNVNLSVLSSSNYLVRLTAPNYTYYSQIIKK
nr:T9SS type A sorting domain-containing protein [uncultured Flavobacterium sp.]